MFVEDLSENYISFDGVNDYLKSANHPNVTNGISGTNFSFLFRIKFISFPSDGNSNDRFFNFNRSSSTYSNQFQLRFKSDFKLAFYMDGGGSGGSNSGSSNSALEIGQWYDLAFVKSGTSFKIYIDGTLDKTFTVSNRSYSNPQYLYIGGNTRDSWGFANMHLKKTQAYNVALSIDEINQNFLSGSNSYNFFWDVDSGGAPSDGTYYATVAAADKAGNSYVAGTQSITFTLDASAPTVILTDTDSDNIISTTLSPTNTVTITASFSKPMEDTPTISITGVVTNVAMTIISGTNSYTYNWNTSTPTLAAGDYSVTVSGTDAIGNAYVGTDSITFTISPTSI